MKTEVNLNKLDLTVAKEQIANSRAQLEANDRALTAEMQEAVRNFTPSPAKPTATQEEQKNSAEPATNVDKQGSSPLNNPQQTRNSGAPGDVPPPGSSGDPSPASASLRDQYGPAFGPLGYLNTLPEEKQEYVRQIIAEYPLRKAAEILSDRAPDGFDRPITHDALYRFGKRRKQSSERRQLDQIAAQTRTSLDDSQATDQQLTTAAMRFLRASLLDTITEINGLDMIATVHKMLNQLRRTDLAERHQVFVESKAKTAASECQPTAASARPDTHPTPSGNDVSSVQIPLKEQAP
jgi:hypothetical protein